MRLPSPVPDAPPDRLTSLPSRFWAAFAVHPYGETPVSETVAADLAARARRRSRIIAWTGFLSAFPLFYLDHWRTYEAGLWDEGTIEQEFFAWRVFSAVTLGAWLWWDRRTPRAPTGDLRLANVFVALAIVQAAMFGIWFEDNPPSYPMYSFLLLLLAVLVHPPSRWALWAYASAVPIVVVGALLRGTDPALVVVWTSAFVIPTVLVVIVDRVVYRQAYRTLDAEHRLGRANAELATALDTLRRTQHRLVEAERQAERTRISRDLHDSVGAQLSSLLAGVELARLEQRATDADDATVTLDDIETDARDALQQLRETVWALHTPEITVEGLAAQLRRFAEARARRAGLHAAVHAEGERDAALPATHALQLYRIGQEAVQNAAKHSGGRTLSIHVVARGARVVLRVADDGTFRPPVPVSGDGAPSGFGMRTMRERAEALGGTLDVSTSDGTVVEAAVPLAEAVA